MNISRLGSEESWTGSNSSVAPITGRRMGSNDPALSFMMEIGTNPTFIVAEASKLMLRSNRSISLWLRFRFLAKRTMVSISWRLS